MGAFDADPEDDDFDAAAALHRHLEATEERPVAREAGWHLGEAQALAGQIAAGGLEPGVVRDRAETILDLLGEFETTGDPEADDHVEAARELASRLAR
ncbi:hypothetical protein [Halorubrum vacuolatum]|uniref:DUF8152 domain-containing protein n=1 Tax=Halorubrum vacuolatum TaxID=63740 RepID=A0A238W233_HALVU|nr:hypothetical protein [Halorubrum vacuolatum]SNR40471.1 hypothetical protein SAMN06264855_10539 [Halorubrum vacuolatum]